MPRQNAKTAQAIRDLLAQGPAAPGDRQVTEGMAPWLAAAGECQRELMSFVSGRLTKDAETVQLFIGSKGPADVVEVQTRWFREAVEDYAAEMNRVLEIYTRNPVNPASRPTQRRR
jgi:hypothetical protein